jgi:hypothetical protein
VYLSGAFTDVGERGKGRSARSRLRRQRPPASASGSTVPGDLRSACAARRAVTGRSVRPRLPRRAPAARACGSAVPPSAAPLTATCAPAPGARYASTHQLRTAARVLLGLHELRYTARPSRRPRRAHDVLLRRDARRQHGGRVGVSLVTQGWPTQRPRRYAMRPRRPQRAAGGLTPSRCGAERPDDRRGGASAQGRFPERRGPRRVSGTRAGGGRVSRPTGSFLEGPAFWRHTYI